METISVRDERYGKRVVLTVDDEPASECWIVPITIRVGRAQVRVDGIGGVETMPQHRLKGYASRVLHRAIEEMTAGDAALTMLYGIPDFYHRFGYVTAGPEYLLFLYDEKLTPTLPEGWSVREFTAGDLPHVQAIYEQQTLDATGVVVRDARSSTWSRLLDTPGNYPQDECWVAVSPEGQVEGYAWRARWCWSVREILEREYPTSLVWGEVVASSPLAAETLLRWCRQRAREEAKEEALLSVPPDTNVAIAARYHNARFEQIYQANGGSMVRVLNPTRLLSALKPELERRIRCQPQPLPPFQLQIRTEVGESTVVFSATGECAVVDRPQPEAGKPYTLDMPQGVLARLALGFAPARDLCARLQPQPQEDVVRYLEALFPQRFQHAYLPDRY